MYVPAPNAMDDEDDLRGFVAAVGSAQLISVTPDGLPAATLLPIRWQGDTVNAHFARANPHWQTITPDAPVLLVVSGPEAYVSPTWYPSKAEHGRVVPTWNYSAVQLRGTARLHHDPGWLRTAVDDLVEAHEAERPAPWSTTDAPARFVDGQLRGIVGVQIMITEVIGKAKLSQNRSTADQRGVITGLTGEPSRAAHDVADQMRTRVSDQIG